MKILGMGAGLLLVSAASLNAQEFEPPFRLTSNGIPISVDTGHASPFFGDLDQDGLFELLVGQYGQGRLRIYRNTGTNERPTFDDDFRWLIGGREIASVAADRMK